MKFDYSFIKILGATIYEPMVIVTNAIFLALCIIYFLRLQRFKNLYALNMASFILCLGLSMVFGAAGHAAHFQLGQFFFKSMLFLMNAFSLLSVYFCFRAAFIFSVKEKSYFRKLNYFIMVWLLLCLVVSVIVGNFLPIKIHAGLVLIYSLIVHIKASKARTERGNKIVVTGILISFLSLISHSLGISLHKWFNHKDIAHVIMIISLIIIYKGVYLNALDLEELLKQKKIRN